MSQPKHSPGPLDYHFYVSSVPRYTPGGSVIREEVEKWDLLAPNGTAILSSFGGRYWHSANARLLTAAYNAIDSAAAKVGVNAIELAERMAGGDIADLITMVGDILVHWDRYDTEGPYPMDALIEHARAIHEKVKGHASKHPASPPEPGC